MSRAWLNFLIGSIVAAQYVMLVAMPKSDRSEICDQLVYAIVAPLPSAGAAPGKFMSQSQLLLILSAFIQDEASLPLRVDEVDGVGRIWIRCSAVVPAARGVFESLVEKPHGLEVLQAAKSDLLDSGLYNQLRTYQRRVIEIPETAVELAAQIFGGRARSLNLQRFGDWQKLAGSDAFELKIPSRVKARTRALYRGDGFSLALSLEPQFVHGREQEAQARVIETEVIVRRPVAEMNGNHNHDFFVYDAKGELAKCSSFFSGKAIVIGSAPQTCMSCHFNAENRSFGLDPDSFAGRPIENWEKFPLESLPILQACPKNSNAP
jgi:hypothetical protein